MAFNIKQQTECSDPHYTNGVARGESAVKQYKFEWWDVNLYPKLLPYTTQAQEVRYRLGYLDGQVQQLCNLVRTQNERIKALEVKPHERFWRPSTW